MKRLLTALVLVLFALDAQAQYRTVSIRDIQRVPLDSLLACDALQNSNNARWTLQTSDFYPIPPAVRETIEVVAQVIVPPKVITFTGSGWTLILRDPEAGQDEWSYLMVRVGFSGDTASLYGQNFLNLQQGDVVRLRGYVDEFPSGNMNSYTQFVPIGAGFQVIDIGTPLPAPLTKEVQDFYEGIYPGGKTKWSAGEPFEGAYVELTDLTVTGYVSQTNGTFSMVDAYGNEISTLDASEWFTLRAHRDPTSTYALPKQFQRVDTVRGYITTNSGQEAVRGYRIAPVFPGDLVLGEILPGVSTHRRNPVVVTPVDTPQVSVRAYQQAGGQPLESVVLYTSVNNGPFVADTMQGSSADSTYVKAIGPFADGAFVKYYIVATDTAGNTSTSANSATGASAADTSKGFFFFTSLSRPLVIQDIQYTPYPNGRTGYLGATVSLTGIVTADTSDLNLNSNGTTPWYIQAGHTPWSGIWITGPDSVLAGLRKGDSVTVTGSVTEDNNVTKLINVQSPLVVHSTANAQPMIMDMQTAMFGANAANGDAIAEPWEGIVVRFNNVTVVDVYPTFADQTEYLLDDGSGPVLVRRDGMSRYSNVPGDTMNGKTLIHVGDTFSWVQGVVYFSFNRYKFVPRGDGDFGTFTVGVTDEPAALPEQFSLAQNYPNPFNPSTDIRYRIVTPGFVSLRVFNILGQEVATLVNKHQPAGEFTVRFDARRLSSGVYFYRVQSGMQALVKKMMFVK